MIFSSPIFLFFFLPLVLTLYPLFSRLRMGNAWLLLMSIVFYAWGEPVFIFLMLGSALVNFLAGLAVDRQEELPRRKLLLTLGIIFNLGLLLFFKYTNFLVAQLNHALAGFGAGPIHMPAVRLPIGISFFTFHALSYLMDIYRRKTPAARTPQNVALYIFFFPQLIAGPILRWSAMAPQFARRTVSAELFAEGVRRFIYGLAKKMLIANTLGLPAAQIFSLPGSALTPALAWFGTLTYGLQIYFDFSGYSDMAIGMGKMFGFEFIENFNHPYAAESIRDFWRRWHISLSTWFRDYLYIPLGGNQISPRRTCLNLLIVFFLCGLWHGAGWTFVVWGLYHGVFLILERTSFGAWLQRMPEVLRHLYALLVIAAGWVIFRADNLSQAARFFEAMCGFGGEVTEPTMQMIVTRESLWAALVGIIFSGPLRPWIKGELSRLAPSVVPRFQLAVRGSEPLFLMVLLVLSAAWLAGNTYNPFIYFRF